MKKISFMMPMLFGMMLSMSFTSCSKDDDNNNNGGGEEIHNVHYDVWVSIGVTSGMGNSDDIIVKNVNALDDAQQSIAFLNEGTDVSAKLYQESAIKGKYYYQIPKEKDRFGKYEITNNGVKTIAETKFDKNTYQDRRYCFAWTGANELVILAANGDKNDVIWTKLNTTNMSIVAEGSLNLPAFTPDVQTYSTSGLATYRASDNKILYFFCEKAKKSNAKGVYVAIVDAKTMTVESVDVNTTCDDMSGTAYGELLQRKMFLDENDNLYLPVQSQIPESEKSTCAYSRILRIKKGENKFDTTYLGMKNGTNTGKIVTCDYIGNGKALLYMQNPEYTGTSDDNKKGDGWGISNYNCFYAIYDLTATTLTELKYEGKNLPYSAGNFSQRSFALGSKVIIGTNPKDELPTIYIYNTKDGKVTKGSTIAEGYELSRLVYIENE